MSECKYSKCKLPLMNPKANTCCDAHRKAWKREVEANKEDRANKAVQQALGINPDTETRTDTHEPGQNNPDTPELTTRTEDNPDKRTEPGQPSPVREVNYLDPQTGPALEDLPFEPRKLVGSFPLVPTTHLPDPVLGVHVPAYALVPDTKVYGRRAVSFPGDTFKTRPEPGAPTDTPCPQNRCVYTTLDGTRYMIDACGIRCDQINGQYQPDVQPVCAS